MKRLVLIVALATVLCVGVVSCGGSGSDGDGGAGANFASEIDDGATKFFARQRMCPVCDSKPLKKEFYADVNGKRIYFDKQECVDKFNSDKQKYVKKLQQRAMTELE